MSKPVEKPIAGIRAINSILDDSTRLYYFMYRLKDKIRNIEDEAEKERLTKLLEEIEKYRPDSFSDID